MSNYQTYDIGLASSLQTVGFKILKIEKIKDNGKDRGRFCIEGDEKEILDVVNDFYSNALKLSALDLLQSQKTLKTWLYSVLEGRDIRKRY